jgi:cytoskeletal protein CcmA (bactofilin family)
MFSLKGSGSKIEAVIGPQTEIEGSIRTNEGIRVDGKIKGGVNAEAVFVGHNGSVFGGITANKVVINGKVKGNVAASDTLELLSSGQILGDIKTSKLIIADGASFEGNCQMIRTEGQVIELNPDSSSSANERKHLKVVGEKR